MATMTTEAATTAVRPRLLDKASWSALFAGFFVGVGTLFLLLSLGTAVGFTSVQPGDPGSWRSMGIGVGIWGAISAIAAAFFSAWVAARLSTATDRGGGMLHGVTLWGLTWAVALWVGWMAVGGALSAAGQVTGAAASAAGSGGGSVSGPVVDQALTQANAWLRDNGKPTITRAQMEATLKDVWSDATAAIRQGRSPATAIDRESLVGSIAANTRLSRQDANEIAARVQQQLQGALQTVSGTAGDLGRAATNTAQTGAWGAFFGALLTLIASAIGGAIGIPKRARAEAEALRVPAGRPLTPQHA